MILVTGGTGYIGSHTIIDLIESNQTDLVSLDNFDNSTAKTLDRIEKIANKKIVNFEIDLRDQESTRAFFEKNQINSIIHFAAHKAVNESVDDPLKYYRNNIQTLVNLLECCKDFNINHFIFSSSCTVYGQPEKLPVDENSPVLPAESPYGNTKQIGEEIIRDFCIANPGFKAIALRYFNPVGAHISGFNGELPNGVPNNLVPFITQTAIGIRDTLTVHGDDYDTRDGSCIRDFIHVSDIAHAHTLAIQRLQKEKNKEHFEVFNLGTGEGVTVLEAIKAFNKVSGQELNYQIGPRRDGDVVSVYSDSTKAETELGWKPQYSLDDMMLSAWKWEQYLNHHE